LPSASVARPLHDTSGNIVGAVNLIVDDAAAADACNQQLVQELNHRVKNALGSALAIVSKTLRGGKDFGAARLAVEQRLVALANAHDLLAADLWRSVGLADVVRSAIADHPLLANRLRLSGIDIRLTPKFALAIAMALNELWSNAFKFGALTTQEGFVQVSWRMTCAGDGRRLHLVWQEVGGPPVAPPRRKGVGARLIEWGLPAELGGEAHLEFARGGLVCHIDVRLADNAIEVHS